MLSSKFNSILFIRWQKLFLLTKTIFRGMVSAMVKTVFFASVVKNLLTVQ